MIEHIETLCNSKGDNDTKHLEDKPKHSKNWNNIGIQEIEAEYDPSHQSKIMFSCCSQQSHIIVSKIFENCLRIIFTL